MSASVASPGLPRIRWWATLLLLLATGFLVHWGVAAVLLFLAFVMMARPFDFLMSYLVMVTGAFFVTMAGAAGALTIQLSLMTILVVMMLFCYVLATPDRLFAIRQTSLTVPLLAFVGLSVLNAARGLLVGNEPRYIGIELFPILGLGSSLLLANAFRPADFRFVVIAIIVMSFGPTIRGLIIASEITHSVTVYSMAVPGIVGVLLINLALRSQTLVAAVGLIALSLPLFLHQFITFGRGLWTGCIAALVLSLVVFAGIGRGTGTRWKRAVLILSLLVGLGGLGAIQAAILLGHADLLANAATRFSSIGSADESYESRSTIVRLWEYAIVAKHLRRSPVVGFGLGYTYPVTQPWGKTATQWHVHQNYLLVWLKQGLIGLVLFMWMIWSAIRLGVREARRRTDPWEASWCATMAGGTLFLAVFSISNFPFAEVSGSFLLALLWGVTMAQTRSPALVIKWSPAVPAAVSRAID